ncbi:unnamed protein product, partial [Discosporangium mesarthrocarpum]
ADGVDDELRRYLLLKPIKEIKRQGGSFTWWKTNRKYFPHLYKVACKFLSIQDTSASSERFSAAGNIVTPNSNRISCKVVDDLVVLDSSKR